MKLDSKFVKGLLLMASVVFAALQTGNVIWASTIILTICVGITYYVKNYLSPSDSPEGQLNWKNIISALILAVATGVSDSIATLIVNGTLNWGLLWTTVSSVVVTYLGTTFFSGQITTET
jgi:magnesium-transporting ATPase (P-type)